MRRKTQIMTAVVAVVLSAGIGTTLIAQPSQDSPAAEQAAESETTVKGTVIGMNLNGEGEANGLLIKTADGQAVTQINFPPHMAAAIGKAVKEGTGVTAQTRPLPPKPGPRDGPGGPKGGPKDGPKDGPGPKGDRPAPPPPPPADHPVRELVSLTPDGGTAINVIRPDEMPTVTAKGKVVRLNYAREGQVDGAVLDDGTFVHVGPKEAEDLSLAVGQSLDVEGTRPPKAGDGSKVIRAAKVNGTAIERPRPAPPTP